MFVNLDIGLYTVESLRDALIARLPRAAQGDEKEEEKDDGMYALVYSCNIVDTDYCVYSIL